MSLVKILEAVMIVCFGAAWPFALIKSWKDRTTKGKSVAFLLIVLMGYLSGIVKVVLTDGFGGWLLIPYGLNFFMVSADALIYLRNKKLDLERQKP
ncbi:hypothetical protein FACS1894204_08930 [Synergistales bacterium]|nr:hypothetical protein FACS1894204_08930 [Synergistales bacterium]